MATLRRQDVLYPEESYKIVGALFNVYNEIGPGHHEKYYQRAVAEELIKRGFKIGQQVYTPLLYKEKVIGKQFLDFLIEDRIILEIKKGSHFSKRHIDQVLSYLKTKGIRLAILANFGDDGIKFRRLVNFDIR